MTSDRCSFVAVDVRPAWCWSCPSAEHFLHHLSSDPHTEAFSWWPLLSNPQLTTITAPLSLKVIYKDCTDFPILTRAETGFNLMEVNSSKLHLPTVSGRGLTADSAIERVWVTDWMLATSSYSERPRSPTVCIRLVDTWAFMPTSQSSDTC